MYHTLILIIIAAIVLTALALTRYFYHRVVAYNEVEGSLDVPRIELADYLTYRQEIEDRHFDLVWAGVDSFQQHKLGDVTYASFRFKGQYYEAIPCYAKRACFYKNYDELMFINDCRFDKLNSDLIHRFCLGTLVLTERFRKIYNKQKSIASMNIHFDCADAPIEEIKTDEIALPDTLPWAHAENELVAKPEFTDFPELNEAWQEVLNKVAYGDNLKFAKLPKTRLPKCIEPTSHTVLIHPNYGQYGVISYRIKHGFQASVNRSRTKIHTKGTHSVAIGPHIPAMLPRWNRRDPSTIAYGAAGRIGREPVKQLNRQRYLTHIYNATSFIIDLLQERGMRPTIITPTESLRWLASTHFPGRKKIKYLKAFSRVITPNGFIPFSEFNNEHEAFPKNECYLDPVKPQRMILAGNLEMAAILGPACALLGNYFFSTSYTSKKIPEILRPAHAQRRFGDGRVILNDMSAFEGSIDREIKDMVEHRILKFFFPDAADLIDRCNEDLDFWCMDTHVHSDTMRCSGDPQTSLGNSFVNLASILACMESMGIRMQDVVAWVEGDDSLVKVPENWGEEELRRYESGFADMGFATKMEIKDFVGDAGYCSMFFNREGILIPSVGQTILDFPMDHSGFLNRGTELLALKAMSLQAVSPNMPITWAISRYYGPKQEVYARIPYNLYEFEELRRQGCDVRVDSNHMIVHAPANLLGDEPDDVTRELFAQKYHITPKDQEKIEERILNYGVIGILKNRRGHNNWTYLDTICKVDGIDLQACRTVYKDARRSGDYVDFDDFLLSRGPDGFLCRTDKQRPVQVDSVSCPDVVCHRIISPVQRAHDRIVRRILREKNLFTHDEEYREIWRRYHKRDRPESLIVDEEREKLKHTFVIASIIIIVSGVMLSLLTVMHWFWDIIQPVVFTFITFPLFLIYSAKASVSFVFSLFIEILTAAFRG